MFRSFSSIFISNINNALQWQNEKKISTNVEQIIHVFYVVYPCLSNDTLLRIWFSFDEKISAQSPLEFLQKDYMDRRKERTIECTKMNNSFHCLRILKIIMTCESSLKILFADTKMHNILLKIQIIQSTFILKQSIILLYFLLNRNFNLLFNVLKYFFLCIFGFQFSSPNNVRHTWFGVELCPKNSAIKYGKVSSYANEFMSNIII